MPIEPEIVPTTSLKTISTPLATIDTHAARDLGPVGFAAHAARDPSPSASSVVVLAVVRARLDVHQHLAVGQQLVDVGLMCSATSWASPIAHVVGDRDVQVDVALAAGAARAQLVVADDELAAMLGDRLADAARARRRAAPRRAARASSGSRAASAVQMMSSATPMASSGSKYSQPVMLARGRGRRRCRATCRRRSAGGRRRLRARPNRCGARPGRDTRGRRRC